MKTERLLKVAIALAVAYLAIAFIATPTSPQDAHEETYRRCMKSPEGYKPSDGITLQEFCRIQADVLSGRPR